MGKCNKVTKKVEKAGRDLQNPNSSKQKKGRFKNLEQTQE